MHLCHKADDESIELFTPPVPGGYRVDVWANNRDANRDLSLSPHTRHNLDERRPAVSALANSSVRRLTGRPATKLAQIISESRNAWEPR